MKRIIVLAILFLTSTAIYFVACEGTEAAAPSLSTQEVPHQWLTQIDHRITLEDAKDIIGRKHADAVQVYGWSEKAPLYYSFKVKGAESIFGVDAIGVRVYDAEHEDGTPTRVLMGIDDSYENLVGGEDPVILQWPMPCPPFCDPECLECH